MNMKKVTVTDEDTVTINGLYTTVFLRADWIPAALQRNGLNTFCKEVGNIYFLS